MPMVREGGCMLVSSLAARRSTHYWAIVPARVTSVGLARCDVIGWHRRATARGDVDQRIRRKARQAPIDILAMEDERRRVENAIRHVRPPLRERGIGLFGYPHAVLHDEWLLQRSTHRPRPFLRARQPAEDDPLAAVLVVGFEDEVPATLGNERHQVNGLALELGAPLLDTAGPGNVARDGLMLRRREEGRVALIAEHRQAGFLVQNLAAKGIDHADRSV